MRPKHPPAAESGVGEPTARESEAPNSGQRKERAANAHHNLALKDLTVFRGLFVALSEQTRDDVRAASDARRKTKKCRAAPVQPCELSSTQRSQRKGFTKFCRKKGKDSAAGNNECIYVFAGSPTSVNSW